MDIYDFVQNPTWAGGGMIILGLVFTILPGIPNIGAAARIMRKGVKFKFQVKYPEILSHIDDIPTGCFPAGTLIRMADGSQKRIERVKPGEQVLTRDEFSAERGAGKVARTFVRPHDTLLKIEMADDRSIEATPEHPFWVEGKGFVAARRLARSDLLADDQGSTSAVVRITSRKGRFTVYNFEVAGTHSYFAAAWWVHNDCSDVAVEEMMRQGDGWVYRLEPSDPYIRESRTGGLGEGGWGYHDVYMDADGLVTDPMRGHQGMPWEDWMKTWPYPEAYDFRPLDPTDIDKVLSRPQPW